MSCLWFCLCILGLWTSIYNVWSFYGGKYIDFTSTEAQFTQGNKKKPIFASSSCWFWWVVKSAKVIHSSPLYSLLVHSYPLLQTRYSWKLLWLPCFCLGFQRRTFVLLPEVEQLEESHHKDPHFDLRNLGHIIFSLVVQSSTVERLLL